MLYLNYHAIMNEKRFIRGSGKIKSSFFLQNTLNKKVNDDLNNRQIIFSSLKNMKLFIATNQQFT